MTPTTLVCSFRHPGQFAFTVLAGAMEATPSVADVPVELPRSPEALAAAVQKALGEGRRTIVAWSAYSPSFPEVAAEVRWLRAQIGGGFVAIVGGVHATAETHESLEAGFDFACVGEGERALPALVACAREGGDLGAVPGFARLVGGQVVKAPRPAPVVLDEFPPFAPEHGYYGTLEITRGCIYACRFCQTPYAAKARFRHRSAASVGRWARVLAASGRRDLRLLTPTALSYGSPDEAVHLDAVEALLAMAKEAMGPQGRVYFGTFPSELRPEHVSPQALAVLRRYVANDNLLIGGQSGSQRVLERSKRGHDVEAIVRATRLCLEAGFRPNVDFILGLPGEEPSDVAATVALMQRLGELGARVHGHVFMPLPGTPFRDAAPGTLDEGTRLALERLASKQQLYGHWKAQGEVARTLAARRAR